MINNWYAGLNPLERKTFLLHFLYATLDGLVLGIFIMNEFVFLKSLRGSSLQIGLLFQFSVVMLFFLLFFNEFLRRISKKRKFLRRVGIITRLPLFLTAVFPSGNIGDANLQAYHFLFLAIFLTYYLANPIFFPTINLLLKTNYRHHLFGKLYSWAISSSKVTMLLSTFIFGILLDNDPFAFRWVYPFSGVLSITAIFLLSSIPYQPVKVPDPPKGFFRSVADSMIRLLAILKENKAFRDFELAYMLYGFAYMSTFAVITVFYEKELHLSYSSVAFYKNIFNILAVILMPVFGVILGKMDPRRYAAYTFLLMAAYVSATALTAYLDWNKEILGIKVYFMLFLGVIIYGVFQSMNGLLWYIGSAYFSRAEEAGDYQAVHSFLTGARALVSPLLGVAIYEATGFTFTFSVAVLALLASVVVNLVSYRKVPMIQKENQRNV